MVDSVAGSVVSSQLQTTTRVAVAAQKVEKEVTEATVQAIDDTARRIADDGARSGGRGGVVNIKA
jgi:hypothetical protein